MLPWTAGCETGPKGTKMSAIANEEIRQIAKRVAAANFGSALISDAFSAPKTDWEGDPALEITIVLTEELTASNFPHDAPANTLVQIHDALLERGDGRFPHMRYATLEDLAEADEEEDES
jgi:hypothetical protein